MKLRLKILKIIITMAMLVQVRIAGAQNLNSTGDTVFNEAAWQRIERELKASNDRFHKAELIAGIGHWEFHLDEGTVLLSDGAAQVLGLEKNEYTLDEIDALVLPEFAELRLQARAALIEGKAPYDIHFQIRRLSDGQPIDLRSTGEYDPDTNIVFGVFHDITTQVQAISAVERLRKTQVNTMFAFSTLQLAAIIALILNTFRRIQAEKELKQNLNRTESLVRILQHPAESIPELLNYALQESLTLTESRVGYIGIYDETGKQTAFSACSEDLRKLLEERELPQLIRERKPIVVNRNGSGTGIKRYIAVPLIKDGRLAAVIGLADKSSNYKELDVLQAALLLNGIWGTVARIQTEIANRSEKERFKTTLLSLDEGVIAADPNGFVQIVNQAAERLIGRSADQVIGMPFDAIMEIIDQDTKTRCESPLRRVLETGRAVALPRGTILISNDGTQRHVAASAAPIVGEQGQVQGVVAVVRDITEEMLQQETIEYLSYHDQLTGLHNRHYFEQQLVKLDSADNLPLSILIADLNGLKLANDAFGHRMGDKMIQKTAEIILANRRSADVAARWGGDEFVVLMPRTTQQEAEEFAARLRDEFTNTDINSVLLSVSLGWDTKEHLNQDFKEVFDQAEQRMYRAKLVGGPSIHGEALKTIMAALHEKNSREEEHSLRVSELCKLIGTELGLAEREIEELGIIGMFHDIGKVSIDEQILNKPGKLTDREYREIKRHAEIGYRILKLVKNMEDIAEYVLAHHERWDGGGYPRGLQGEEIPLKARIVAIADAYDAMVSYRPYRSQLTPVQAAEELFRGAGTQFDPDLVQVFVDAIGPHGDLKAN